MLTYDGIRIDIGSNRPHLVADFSVATGMRTLLVGANGSGKSSLLDAAIGARQLRGGRASVASQRPVAYAVQDALSGLLPWLTVWENVVLPARLAMEDHRSETEARTFLADLGILPLAPAMPAELSGGERQMINLIRAACTPADLVFLDEPFAALHSGTRALVIDRILPTFAGKTLLVVSHEPADLELGFNRFLLVQDGAVAEIDAEDARRFLEVST
jgi:putative hydroxymethylpyrimidine transport system ATP-binding protein